ncbi:hypothetical protein [Aurantimonas sp. VKM B-3413]|uniref:hypothetical protein n=1 Tax=Aurantimonas sp. VKM B-3413 TaxID=2779401 RepID=UPI001E587C3E|nr:hypothetical protein [Aurantimonas sp. VKM B-3413]MCB8839528.1 hypothetical protein [Aurantimonas sp. VKM B-3413]
MTAVRRIGFAALLSAAASALVLPGGAVAQNGPRLAQPTDCGEAKAHFEIAREINTPDAYQAHIDEFANCPYASFARILRDKLGGVAAAPAAPAAPAATAAPAPAVDAAPTLQPIPDEGLGSVSQNPFGSPPAAPAEPGTGTAGNPLGTPPATSDSGTASENPVGTPPPAAPAAPDSGTADNPFGATPAPRATTDIGSGSRAPDPFAPEPGAQTGADTGPTADDPFGASPAPGAPVIEQAQMLAETFVSRINELPPMQSQFSPKVRYDGATMSGTDVVMTNLRMTKDDGQPSWSGITFAEGRLVAPVTLPDGSLQASALLLRNGSIREVGALGPDDRVATIDMMVFDKPYLAATGGTIAGDRLGSVSADGVTVSGVTGYDPAGPLFTMASAALSVSGTSDNVPASLVATISNLSFSAAQIAAASETNLADVQRLGYDPFGFDFDLVLDHNRETKALDLRQQFGLKDGGQFRLQAVFDNVDTSAMRSALASGDETAGLESLATALRSARLEYVDQSLTGRALAMAAATQNIDPQLFAAAIPTVVKQSVQEATGSEALATTVSEAIRNFLAQPQSIAISLEPAQPLAMTVFAASLFGGSDPMDALGALNPSLSVNGAPPIPLQLALLRDPGGAAPSEPQLPAAPGGPVAPALPAAPEAPEAPGGGVAAVVSACDTLAADTDDPSKPAGIEGVKSPTDIDHAQAIPACEAAHAAAPNEPRITFELGRAYQAAGRNDDAARLYREAADAGQAVAQYELALAYYDGRGVQADEKEAVKLLQASAAQGNGFAKYWLGVEKVNGTVIPVDYPGASQMFSEAADFGVPEALTELGKMAYRGQGGEVDYARALDYFRQAAAKDVPSGHFYVGFMNALALGGETPNPPAAVADMMKGLLFGDADAESFIVTGAGQSFDLSIRQAIQSYLKNEGFYQGGVDGVLGPGTQGAIAAWRKAKGDS